ncbi:MAG TPA: YwpF family protein [Pseudogracilibacillus sp.]|nr:YwpF family protein [Pseudogracilibacillus sp.]
MKTFKLKELVIVGNEEDDARSKEIALHDGLVINREDKLGWLIEAYIDKTYANFLQSLRDREEIMLQVKITRKDNDPAFFITKILAINDINKESINVLFQGEVIDHRKSRIEEMLRMIIEEGYQGESLLKKFKELI